MSCPTLKQLPPPLENKTGWPWTKESKPVLGKISEGKSWPKISIITPSYNQGKFLEETIRSVLLQGYPNLEYIIIDGGSTDNSVEIIKTYSPWISYWISEPDHGQSHAINKGWKMATGEIFAYLNSDDTYLPGALITAERLLQEYPDVSMIYGDCNLIDEDSDIIGTFCGKEYNLKTMFFTNIVPQQTVFFRSHVFDKVGFLDENLHFVMDRDMWIRIGLEFKVKYCAGFTGNLRVYSSTKSIAQTTKFLPERIRVINKTFENLNISKGIKVSKRKAISYNYILMAKYLYKEKKIKQARYNLIKSILVHPPVLFNCYVIKTLIKCLIGEKMNLFCRKYKYKIRSFIYTPKHKTKTFSEK